MSTAEVETTEGDLVVPKFAVQVDHPRNDDLVVQCIPGCRLRSTIRGGKAIVTEDPNESRVPLDQARTLASLPPIPGMILAIDPLELKYTITDPLRDDTDMLERIMKWMKNHSPYTLDSLNGIPQQKGELDVHRMKSLCKEVWHALKNRHVKMVAGAQPDIDDIDDLPGKYLLNPGSVVMNTQPMFAQDWDAWVEKLTASGG